MPGGGEPRHQTCNVTLDARAARIDPDAHASATTSGSPTPVSACRRRFCSARPEPFFTTKEFGTGTGLGLSSVFDFAKQSGGFVTLASATGRGRRSACISLALPRNPPPVVLLSVRDALPGGDGELILVVEDNDGVREIALKRLEALGYAVLEARTGPEAIQILECNQPVDLVFSDILLPGGDGA